MSSEKQPRAASAILLTAVFSLLASILILLGFAQAVASSALSADAMSLGAAAAALAGSFICGIGSVRIFGSKALISGLGAGLVYFLVLLLLGAVFFLRMKPEGSVVNLLLVSIAGGGLAGILGSLGTKKKHKRR
ncbi:hypothetical protein FACS189425_09910 [Clostridia bacterium]|nr:hypothetical protein FACS189425_09910 [Clostridia bacterium]